MDSIGAKLHMQHKEAVEMNEERKTCPILGEVCDEERCAIYDQAGKVCGILAATQELRVISEVLCELNSKNKERGDEDD